QVAEEEEAGEAPRRMNGELPVVVGTGEIRILRVQFLDANAVGRSHFQTGEDLVVAVTIRTTEPVESPVFGVALFRDDGSYLYGPNTRFDGVLEGTFHGVYTFFIRYPGLPLLGGTWRISVAFFDKGHVRPHVWHNQLYEIRVTAAAEDHGMVQLPHRWGLLTHYEPS
ncbi:MAG TPA: Wzt carbohydrate-binding domain-containing protein, partial [Myxococcota bacterium]|nr:Wzt carbohydrate-binding domain-containing protein [Myxococcota bacterium]